MADHFEITFEDVENGAVNDLIGFLLGCASSVYKVGDIGGEDIKNVIINYDFQWCLGESAETWVLRNFLINISTVIPVVFLRIFRYGKKIDVEISFASSDAGWVAQVMRSAKEFFKVLPRKFGIKNIYAGMEPSSDEETRYFTNDTCGPLY